MSMRRLWPNALCAVLTGLLTVAGCGGNQGAQTLTPTSAPNDTGPPPSVPMGGAKSVMTFFVTSRGLGKGGNLGGLAGADAHCQALAEAEKAGDHTWRAYLSTMATKTEPAVNARDRIGKGPWYNAQGDRIARNLDELHSAKNAINKDNAVTERLDPVGGVNDTPNVHD